MSAPTDTAVQHYIDEPESWAEATQCVLIRGWCFTADHNPIRSIRLRAGDRTLDGVTGLSRPDVKVALPQVPDDNSGFEIRGTIAVGRQTLLLEAQTADGCWHLLQNPSVKIRRRLLPLWLGGGNWTDLMYFQMPAHMAYPPRPLRPDRLPAPAPTAAWPRFAIVTPSYQQARFLRETMRSVLDQRGVACDYVVQDGGSTDGSADLIRSIAAEQEAAAGNESPRPRLAGWSSERDHGQADAIVRGFARTAGAPTDLMAWLNSDDFLLPGALAFVADYFARHPEVDVIYGHRIVVDKDSNEIARWFLPPHSDTVLRLNDFVPQETLFWRRRLWDAVGGFDATLKFAMDWDLLLRFSDRGARIVRLPYFLSCFRVHPSQKTSALMHTLGRREIDQLRTRANGRPIPPTELERDPLLIRYLRKSAFIQFLWRCGLRAS